jgi:outer membrane protein OmpA-like peptidoglycan-associated protein
MALRTARFRPGGRPDRPRLRQTGGFAGRVALVALGISLPFSIGGCGAVDTWRSLSGVDKNDPDPQTAPFSGNLAAAEAGSYPNLADFPPMPTRTTNTAERQKLAQSLIADRSALAADSGFAAGRPDAKAAPAAPAAPTATLASAAPSNLQPINPAAASPAAAPAGKTAPNSTQSGHRAANEPPEPGPLDSSLQMPDVRSVPEPESTQPPPPAVAFPAAPRPASVAALPPAAVASAMPQLAPPEPLMAPVASPPPAAAKSEPKRVPASTTVATLDIRTAVATPAVQDQAQIERVAALYRENQGNVRVLAYAAATAGGGDPLDSYHAALERAEAVAKALVTAGIPADKIQTQATPAAGAQAAGRVEIQFTQ